MKHIFALTLFLLLGSCHSISQDIITRKNMSGKAKKMYEKASQYFSERQLEKAKAQLEKTIRSYPNFVDAHLKLASTYYDEGNYGSAESSLEKVIAADPQYLPQAFYSLAITEMNQEKYAEAAQHLNEMLKIELDRPTLVSDAQELLKHAQFAAEAIKHPVPFEPRNIGNSINTAAAEYFPSFSADGSLFIYTVQEGGQEDFFYSSKNASGAWNKGVPMDAINTLENEGAQTITADGKYMVFTACNRNSGYGSCDLYFAQVINAKWTKPQNLGNKINSKLWESQPSISANGDYLYFCSNRPGGLGGKDLWISKRMKDGTWDHPINLGDRINTIQDDQTPFIHADGKTLYYSSKGWPGMGEGDIFISRWEGKNWSLATNVGYPINTLAEDASFAVSLDGSTAYYASTEGEGHQGEVDIYSFELPSNIRPNSVTYVSVHAFDLETSKNLEVRAELTELNSNTIILSQHTDSDGQFLSTLPAGKSYALNIKAEGYVFFSEHFDLPDSLNLYQPFKIEAGLSKLPEVKANSPSTPLKSNTKRFVLKNIFFESGSAVLEDRSQAELQYLFSMMENNPDIRIMIHGHTDDVGNDADNLALSEQRAKAVYSYLSNAGILEKRLRYKGYGESEPIESNESESGRRQNRRTEFSIY